MTAVFDGETGGSSDLCLFIRIPDGIVRVISSEREVVRGVSVALITVVGWDGRIDKGVVAEVTDVLDGLEPPPLAMIGMQDRIGVLVESRIGRSALRRIHSTFLETAGAPSG